MVTDGSDTPNGGVRVTNADIYNLLLQTNREVASVDQTVRDIVIPTLIRHTDEIDVLEKAKADAVALLRSTDQVERLKIQVYGVMAGLVAALFGASKLGIF